MARHSELLESAVAAIAAQVGRKSAASLFAGRGGRLVDAGKQVKNSDDFELISWLIIMETSHA
jgi:hypothetical protein